ncbi:MAG TPA: mercury resistance system periplasmic binding protein MerP [Usitatibacter sp.]|nr:mercury resistance system periplasmic binding protein MerP [Usitatibacter sp.]
MKRFLAAIAFGLAAAPGWAAERTVTLSIPSMDCPACPITVKKALAKVPGVARADVNFDKREATVTFDDAKASVGDLTDATKNAGYPSKPVAKAI